MSKNLSMITIKILRLSTSLLELVTKITAPPALLKNQTPLSSKQIPHFASVKYKGVILR